MGRNGGRYLGTWQGRGWPFEDGWNLDRQRKRGGETPSIEGAVKILCRLEQMIRVGNEVK